MPRHFLRPSAHRLPLPLVRAWARIRRAIQPRRVEIVYSKDYKLRLGSTPIDPDRGEKILGFLLSEGLVGRQSPRRPQRASIKALSLVHTDEYLDQLHQPGALVPIVGFSPGDEVRERALEAQRCAVGGTREATRIALQRNKIVYNLGGGFHHARPEAGRGFCIFNDVAVAIREQRGRGFEGPILIIDLDLHDGDGTRAVFAHDPTVFTFSVHNRHWDEAAATASESIELSGDVEDDEYLQVIRERVPRLLEFVRPKLIFFLAGTDPAHDDALGNWRISGEAMLERDLVVFSAVEEVLGETPIVVTLAGGYGNNTWRYSARSLAWLLGGQAIEPPTNEAVTLARYRKLLERVDPERLQDDAPEMTAGVWNLSESDIWGDLMGAKRSPRLLGWFSPHGVELVLERSGFFDRLRNLGFERPNLQFDLDDPAGETVRIFGDSRRKELLVELRLRRDSRALPGFDLLSLEWLLMQNPRGRFDDPARRLPGQTHPGLGLLNDMMALLIMVCEQLQLDGISFVPSHYHLARQGKRLLRFIEPADAAWFGAVADAVAGLPLRAATRAVEDGLVADGRGEPVTWKPMLMVLAVSERLRARIDGDDYEQAVERARAGLDFRLASSD